MYGFVSGDKKYFSNFGEIMKSVLYKIKEIFKWKRLLFFPLQIRRNYVIPKQYRNRKYQKNIKPSINLIKNIIGSNLLLNVCGEKIAKLLLYISYTKVFEKLVQKIMYLLEKMENKYTFLD